MAVLAAGSACSKSDTSGPSEPTQLQITGGQQQSGEAGTLLPSKVIVLASNARGPVADVTITMATETQGGGSVSPRSAKTGADGTAQFTWRLGSKVGVQTLTASTAGATPISSTVSATALAAPPSIVIPVSSALQFVVVGRAVPILPAVEVTDGLGNPIGGVSVTFEVVQGASVLTGTSQTTDAQGHASLGGWTLGSAAGSYTIRGRIASGAAAQFEARGIPAALTMVAGASQTVNAGTAVPVLPAVRATRDDGSPLPGVVVNFMVIGGGGTVTGSSAVTGSDGIARPTRWVLGTAPGLNRLEASTQGQASVTFDATGVAAAPAFVVATAGTSQSGFFGNYLAGSPEVTVTDAQGNPVAGLSVSLQVSEGGGRVTTGLSLQTDFLGRAAATSWRLGAAGTQAVTATAGSLPPVIFTATGSTPPASTFRIEVRYPGTQPSPTQRAAFDAAVTRWGGLILAGGAPYLVKPDEIDPNCGGVSGTIDGVVIVANLINIDGVRGVLGRAGPCVLRDDGFLTVSGLMEFDIADLPGLEADGTLNHVILHEMAHVLGFGTIWTLAPAGFIPNAFLNGAPGGDPTFNGPAARVAFLGAVAQGTAFTGVPVPVEATGGAGTAYSHWRESIFTTELMTGFLGPGLVIPLSAVTAAQFRDLGYVVNDALADTYTFQASLQAGTGPSFQLVEGTLPGLMTVINRQGTVVARLPRVFK